MPRIPKASPNATTTRRMRSYVRSKSKAPTSPVNWSSRLITMPDLVASKGQSRQVSRFIKKRFIPRALANRGHSSSGVGNTPRGNSRG